MNKTEAVNKIRAAKQAHMSWVMKADALIYGIPLENNQVPVDGTECIFGQWYYGEGQNLKYLASFKAIEQPHFELHSTYAQIFKLLFESDDKSFLKKLFGQSSKQSEANTQKARELFPKLKEYSNEVIKYLDVLDSEIESMA
ncbi:MAG: CZB domain-containing protein [Gammaproteobacteria bacterium]